MNLEKKKKTNTYTHNSCFMFANHFMDFSEKTARKYTIIPNHSWNEMEKKKKTKKQLESWKRELNEKKIKKNI